MKGHKIYWDHKGPTHFNEIELSERGARLLQQESDKNPLTPTFTTSFEVLGRFFDFNKSEEKSKEEVKVEAKVEAKVEEVKEEVKQVKKKPRKPKSPEQTK